MEKLQTIINGQREFQKLVGFPIDSIREVDRNEMSEKYIFKAIEELIEVRKEFPSMLNPWSKTQKFADNTRVAEEFCDVLLFLINFMIVWKFSPSMILGQLIETQRKNFNSFKIKKIEQLNREILAVPTYTSGIGQGNLNAKYIFIGQNPSDKISHGYRFWSDPTDGSSKILLPILEKLGMDKDSYFTNVVKSTTSKNSEPEKSVKDFWLPYLQREIDIVKMNNPEVKIITLGNWANEAFPESIKIHHPASVSYGNITLEQYEEQINKIK